MLNFAFFKGLEKVSLPHFVYNFLRKINVCISKCVFGVILFKFFIALNILLESYFYFLISFISYSILFVPSVLTRLRVFVINLFVFIRRFSLSFLSFDKSRCNLPFFWSSDNSSIFLLTWCFFLTFIFKCVFCCRCCCC